MDNLNRPEWDSYFMALAFVVSQRSLDPVTKHGTVIVDKDRRVISTGYNSPPKGCDDTKIPLTRPQKYAYFLHSEAGAMLFARQDLSDCTIYVTGEVCSRCLGMIIQSGIKRVVCGHVKSACIDENEKLAKDLLLYGQDISIEYAPVGDYIRLLVDTVSYAKNKLA